MTRHPQIEIVAASRAHVGIIANNMRSFDVFECAAFGRTPKQALRLGLKSSSLCFTVKVEGVAHAMFGLVIESAIEGRGCPWMLGSELIYQRPRAMIALGPVILSLFSDSTPHLVNVVSIDNDRAIRMLRKWGFVIDERVNDGFVSFERQV